MLDSMMDVVLSRPAISAVTEDVGTILAIITQLSGGGTRYQCVSPLLVVKGLKRLVVVALVVGLVT